MVKLKFKLARRYGQPAIAGLYYQIAVVVVAALAGLRLNTA
jgi:hypothetical protein